MFLDLERGQWQESCVPEKYYVSGKREWVTLFTLSPKQSSENLAAALEP